MNRTTRLALSLITCFAAACGEEVVSKAPSPLPAVPSLMPGMAELDGRVLGPDGLGVAGATITVSDAAYGATMVTATTAADGRWHLGVLANTTITLKAEAMGYGRTLLNSFAVAPGTSSMGVDFRLWPTATIDQLNTMGGPRVADYGAIALEVRSLSGACDPAGGTISIDPAPLGKVFYGRPTEVMPDASLTSVQTGASPAAWILGTLPPGIYRSFKFAKVGCVQKAGAVEWNGRSYDGHLHIEAKAVSAGVLFVE